MAIREFDLTRGAPVILYLQVRGLDLVVFDEWMRQEARGEEAGLGLATIFYPMSRLERMERDESLGPIPSYAERFYRAVGRTVHEAADVEGAGGE